MLQNSVYKTVMANPEAAASGSTAGLMTAIVMQG